MHGRTIALDLVDGKVVAAEKLFPSVVAMIIKHLLIHQ